MSTTPGSDAEANPTPRPSDPDQSTHDASSTSEAAGPGASAEATRAVPPPPSSDTGYGGQTPVRAGLDSEARNWAMGAHLSALIMFFGIPSLVGPLIVWAVRKDHHPFIAEHAREALNFNLSVLLYAAAAVGLTIVTLGLAMLLLVPLGIAAFIAWLVVTVVAGIKASNGEAYRYPLTIRFVN